MMPWVISKTLPPPFGIWRVLACLWLLFLVTPSLAAVDARVDRAQVYEGDVFTLFIEQRGSGSGDPDLSPLQQDFEIVGTGTSSSFSVVNGRSSSRVTWRVQLRPQRMGELTIPSLSVGNERTPAIALTVADVPLLSTTSADAPAIVEVDVAVDGLFYVQQQIPVSVRLLQGEHVVGGELDRLQLDGALVESLGAEKRYTTNRDGRAFRVTEQRYAVAAERSGVLRIPAISFRGRVAQPRQQSVGRGYPPGTRSFGGQPFPADPFGGRSRDTSSVQPIRVASEPVQIEVLPPAVNDGHWLPAKQLTLKDSWADNPPQLRQGEPVLRVITLQATGLNGSQLPLLDMPEPSAANVYSDASANDTRSDGRDVFGLSRQSFTYVPSQAGAIDIPPLTLRWWNTDSGQHEEVRLAGYRLKVDASPMAVAEPVAAQSAEDKRGFSSWWVLFAIVTAVMVLVLRRRFDFARLSDRLRKLVPRRRARAAVERSSDAGSVAREVAMASAPRQSNANDLREGAHISVREQQGALKAACTQNDPNAAAQALLALARVRWPSDPPTNLGDLGQRMGHGGDEIATLDRALYGTSDSSRWDGAPLWSTIQRTSWRVEHEKGVETGQADLKPLYPQKV